MVFDLFSPFVSQSYLWISLKKLSKKAAPLLKELGDSRQQFCAVRGENYMGVVIRDRKHWERMRSVSGDTFDRDIKYKPKNGNGWIRLSPPVQPRKGTPMIGGTSGYYEPEWDEETTWEALLTIVYDRFADWGDDGPTPTRKFRGPGDILRAARELANSPSQSTGGAA